MIDRCSSDPPKFPSLRAKQKKSTQTDQVHCPGSAQFVQIQVQLVLRVHSSVVVTLLTALLPTSSFPRFLATLERRRPTLFWLRFALSFIVK
jgi:hypothetical protein